MTSVNVLIVEDHPLIVESYKQGFEIVSNKQSINFNIEIANNLDDAIAVVDDYSYMNTCDLIFLDIQLPIGLNQKVLSGEDLGLLIRKKHPLTKIGIITSLNDNYRLRALIKNIDPEAVLIKNDLTPEELINAIQSIITSPPYYTSTVLNLMRKEISKNVHVDEIDRKLLYELSIGTKMIELPDILLLSKAAVEKRKRNLKILLEVEDQSDRELILNAKKRGFI